MRPAAALVINAGGSVPVRARGPFGGWVTIMSTPEGAAELCAGVRYRAAMISAAVRRGDLVRALGYYGHAERLDAVIRWFFDGRRPLRPALEDAWTSAEWPGSADYLGLWRAIARGEPDLSEPLPPGDHLVVYRGQGAPDEPTGISWTLRDDVARWFALTVPRIGPRPKGAVLAGCVPRECVLGYLTDRNEAEIIVDPADVRRGRTRVVRGKATRPADVTIVEIKDLDQTRGGADDATG